MEMYEDILKQPQSTGGYQRWSGCGPLGKVLTYTAASPGAICLGLLA